MKLFTNLFPEDNLEMLVLRLLETKKLQAHGIPKRVVSNPPPAASYFYNPPFVPFLDMCALMSSSINDQGIEKVSSFQNVC